VPLTADFVARRLKELRDVKNYNTQRFVGSWGEDHRKQVVAWSERAQSESSERSH
jgi:hypothetical protein